jgi:argininosuccinate lyase
MKLWEKGYQINNEIEKFTIGNDYKLDMCLIKYDIEASVAHALMLQEIGIFSEQEAKIITSSLQELSLLIKKKEFKIKPGQEDSHTAIEDYLVEKCGNIGKKIHTGRSRNDQVLVAIRLYEKNELNKIKKIIFKFEQIITNLIEKYKGIVLPGFTHTRKAMPLPIHSWLGAFLNSMKDNLILLNSVNMIIDNNPLGSAAGFGVPVIKINKKTTTELLGFSKYYETDLYYQNTRGKIEGIFISALNSIMFDLNKIATDIIFYSTDDFRLIEIPKEFCTGSSIMPHKKNPDALELIRANYHIVLSEEFKIKSLIGNLISGYHRDFQLTKYSIMKAIKTTKNSLTIMALLLNNLNFNNNNINKYLTEDLLSVEKVNQLLIQGVPFRDAYKEIGNSYQ